MRSLAAISIRNPVFAWMLMAGLIIFGGISFFRLGVSQLPDVDFPVVTVCYTLEGAAPEVMETQVADLVEDAVMSMQGVLSIGSTSRQGQACVSADFDLNRNIDVALQEMQTKLAQLQKRLPRNIDAPTFDKSNPEDNPIVWVSLYGDRPRREMMVYVHDTLKNHFASIPGVGEVSLGGYVEPNLRVWLDADKMFQQEITVQDVMGALATEHQEIPAGFIDNLEREVNVRVTGEASSLEEFRNLLIPQRSGAPIWRKIRIGDVAEVEEGLNEVRRISRYQGVPSIGLGVMKQRGSNAVKVAQLVKAKVAEIEKELPEGMKLRVSFDLTQFTEESTRELNFTLLLSALLTGVICWLMLGSFSSTLNVLLAIPTSIVGTFTLLYFFGFTLNIFTLLGLSLAIGIVVDDAILVLENIVRYREQGLSRKEAALKGATEISFAALASTLAILAIFVPVIFMKGIMGKYFYQFGVTISVAVLLSLLEALTLTPMRCSRFVEATHNNRLTGWIDERMKWLSTVYQRTLRTALKRRWLVLIACTALFAFSIFALKWVKKEFVPSQDQGRLMIRVQTPIGSSITFTDEVVRNMEALLSQRADIYGYSGNIGGFGGGQTDTAMLFVTMKPYHERPIVAPNLKPLRQSEMMTWLRTELNKVPGVQRVVIQDLSQSGFTSQRGFPIQLSLRGPEWEKLGELSQTMMKRMQESALMTDIDSDFRLGMPEIRVKPNRERAAQRGVTIENIATTINAMIGGVRIGSYTQGGKRYDIRLRLTAKDRQQPTDISKIWVRNQHGERLRLADVVALNEQPTLVSIMRRDRDRAIRVFANIAPNVTQDQAMTQLKKISKELLPDGYRVVWGGNAQTMQESFNSLMFALALGLVVAYMVLASQFNSFIHPFTVLLALPFSISGAIFALGITGQSLNIFSMIGVLLLMGIVKKNSILLVDFTNLKRQEGMQVGEALITACPIRLRPIIMTSVATIAAAVPPALGFGPGFETRMPMALVVIGGVLLSTVLTLYVIPCAYSLLANLESKKESS